MATLLNQRWSIQVHVNALQSPVTSAGLTVDLAAVLRSIPGVQVWRTGRVVAPADAVGTVAAELQKHHVEATYAPLDFLDPVEPLEAALERSAILPEVWRDLAKPFQLEAVAWHHEAGGGHCWASAGAGKTWIATMWALTRPLQPDGTEPHVLYVVPSSTTEQHRGEVDVELTTDRVRPLRLRAPSARRKGDQDLLGAYVQRERDAGRIPFVICGEAQLKQQREDIERYLQASVTIWDETPIWKADRFKFERTSTGWVEQPLGNLAWAGETVASKAKYRLGTTATPGENCRLDLWGQFRLLQPHSWGKTKKAFAHRYCGAIEHPQNPLWGWTTDTRLGARGMTRCDELAKRMAFFARRIPHEVSHAQLPPVIKRMTRVAVDEQSRELPGLKAELNRALKAHERSPSARSRGLLAETMGMVAAERKTKVVKSRAREMRHKGRGKMLFFTGRKRHALKLAELVQGVLGSTPRDGVKPAVWFATGEMSTALKQEIVDEYMRHPGPCALCVTHQAFGRSWNLQDTDYIGVVYLPYEPGFYEQIIGRGDRHRKPIRAADGSILREAEHRPLLVEFLAAEKSADDDRLSWISSKARDVKDVHAKGRIEKLDTLLAGLSEEVRAEVLTSMVSRLRRRAS